MGRLVALKADSSNADHMFAEMPVTTISPQIHDHNTSFTERGNSAATEDKVLDEIPHQDSSVTLSEIATNALLTVPLPNLEVAASIPQMTESPVCSEMSHTCNSKVCDDKPPAAITLTPKIKFDWEDIKSVQDCNKKNESELEDETMLIPLTESELERDKMSARDIFEIFCSPNRNIVLLSHVIGLHKCTWVDTGQEQNLPVDFTRTLNDYVLVEAGFQNMSNSCPKVLVKSSENPYPLDIGHHRRNTKFRSDILHADKTPLMYTINFLHLPFDPSEFITRPISFGLWLRPSDKHHRSAGIPAHMEIDVARESFLVSFANLWVVVPNVTTEPVTLDIFMHNQQIWWFIAGQSPSLMLLSSGVQYQLKCFGTVAAGPTAFVVAFALTLDAGSSHAQDLPARYISVVSPYHGSTRWRTVIEAFEDIYLAVIFNKPDKVDTTITVQLALTHFPIDPGATLSPDTPADSILVACVWDPGISMRGKTDPWLITQQYYVSAGYMNGSIFANAIDGLCIISVFSKAIEGGNVNLRAQRSISSSFGFHLTVNDLTLALAETLRCIRQISSTKAMGLKPDVWILFQFVRVDTVSAPQGNKMGPLLKMLQGFYVLVYIEETLSNPNIVLHSLFSVTTFRRLLAYLLQLCYQFWNLVPLLIVHEMFGAAFNSWTSMYREAQFSFMYSWCFNTPKPPYVYYYFLGQVICRHVIGRHHNMLELGNKQGEMFLYWQRVGKNGQIGISYILQYLALASTPPYLIQSQRQNGAIQPCVHIILISLYSNLEDKVLFEGRSIVVNMDNQNERLGLRSGLGTWDPG